MTTETNHSNNTNTNTNQETNDMSMTYELINASLPFEYRPNNGPGLPHHDEWYTDRDYRAVRSFGLTDPQEALTFLSDAHLLIVLSEYEGEEDYNEILQIVDNIPTLRGHFLRKYNDFLPGHPDNNLEDFGEYYHEVVTDMTKAIKEELTRRGIPTEEVGASNTNPQENDTMSNKPSYETLKDEMYCTIASLPLSTLVESIEWMIKERDYNDPREMPPVYEDYPEVEAYFRERFSHLLSNPENEDEDAGEYNMEVRDVLFARLHRATVDLLDKVASFKRSGGLLRETIEGTPYINLSD